MSIRFIVCHGGPAGHFATFAQQLTQDKYDVKVYAAEGPARDKFDLTDLAAIPFQCTDDVAQTIALQCASASAVVTDVGHPFDVNLQHALKEKAPNVPRFAYYDNPNVYVQGGYSETAAHVTQAADKVLFANANLTLPDAKKSIGIGYYPIEQAQAIASRREREQESLQAEFFSLYGLQDRGQKIVVYFGGNNDVYFEKAFPAFLRFFSDNFCAAVGLDIIFVLQQHPGAKSKNIDGLQLRKWIKEHKRRPFAPKIVISDGKTDDMQVIADLALYYQTSLGPQFVLAGIPAIQVGHETDKNDILIQEKLCPSVTTPEGFVIEIAKKINPTPLTEEQEKRIHAGLGIKEDWFDRLKQALPPKQLTQKSIRPYFLVAGCIAAVGYLALRFFRTTR